MTSLPTVWPRAARERGGIRRLRVSGSASGRTWGKKAEGARTDARMSVVNMAEAASNYSKLGMPDDVVGALLKPLPITLVDADAVQS